MAYEGLSDEESWDRVAAIIAAAEALAGDDVRADRPGRPTPPSAAGKAGGSSGTPPFRRWAIAVGAAAMTLGGLIVWTNVTEGVTVDQSEPPQVLLAEELGQPDESVSTIPGATTTVPPSGSSQPDASMTWPTRA